MEIRNQYERIVPFIIFVLALLLLFNLMRPMITILLSSILLAYISFPVYQRINKKISNKYVSIILALFTIVMLLLIPFSFLAFEVVQQGYRFHNSLSTEATKGALFGFGCTSADSRVCSVLNKAEKFSLERLSSLGFDKQLQKFIVVIEEKMTQFILSIPIIIAEIFLTLVISFFILIGWKSMLERIIDLLPMRTETINKLIEQFANIAHTVIYAQLFVALVQGIIGTIGFYLFGVPFPIFLGVILAFCSLIPTIGTAIIWLPASIFLMLSGYLYHDPWILAKGIGLFLYGIFIISIIDNLLLGKIVHEKAHVNQIIVIIGVIGGAAMFGVVGIFIGPILLPLLITYFKTFRERFV